MGCPNPAFNGQRYRCGIYCAFEDHLLVYLCCKQVIDPRGSILKLFDSLPTVKSNTIFGKMTLMALEKYSLEIEQQQQHPIPETEISKALSSNIIKKIL